MSRLLAPFLYLSVNHKVKRWFDLYYPFWAALIFGSLIVFWPYEFRLVGERSLIESLNSLLGILIGFFIAALAAVATFPRPEMDELMKGDAATLKLKGRDEPLDLTRRMFLCLLFGYLTLITFLAFLFFTTANVLLTHLPAVGNKPGDALFFGLSRAGFIYGYFFAFFHVLCLTVLGIYYLAWRAVIFDKKIL